MGLNGQKKWIGDSPCATSPMIWARDLADDQVKRYRREQDHGGFKVEKNPETRSPSRS